jgi:DNA-binding NtrC family response regulator
MSLSERVIGLVEDDQIMGESIVQRLSLEGVRVKWWQRGKDAVREMPSSRLDAIVCDIRLPDLNGEELFREAARSSGAPPFVFITGYSDIDQAVRLMRRNGRLFHEPFEIDDFLVRLGELMGPRSASGTHVLGLARKSRISSGC